MSYGFAHREPFRVIAAVDAEQAKPCEGLGKLDCNATYAANLGIEPLDRDISQLDSEEFLEQIASLVTPPLRRGDLSVLICCPPCTDFSRAKPSNHLFDSPKNSLVVKCADFVETLFPEFVVMENARELITGKNCHHYQEFVKRLNKLGYDIKGDVYMLTNYGLPHIRERAIVIASRTASVKTLNDLWMEWEVDEKDTTVRHAIGKLNERPIAAGEACSKDSSQ